MLVYTREALSGEHNFNFGCLASPEGTNAGHYAEVQAMSSYHSAAAPNH